MRVVCGVFIARANKTGSGHREAFSGAEGAGALGALHLRVHFTSSPGPEFSRDTS